MIRKAGARRALGKPSRVGASTTAHGFVATAKPRRTATSHQCRRRAQSIIAKASAATVRASSRWRQWPTSRDQNPTTHMPTVAVPIRTDARRSLGTSAIAIRSTANSEATPMRTIAIAKMNATSCGLAHWNNASAKIGGGPIWISGLLEYKWSAPPPNCHIPW